MKRNPGYNLDSGDKAFWLTQCRWLSGLATDLPSSRKLAIREASESGASRREIADALGVTTQAVDKALKAAKP